MSDTYAKTNFKIVLLVFCILIGSAFSQSRAGNDFYITNPRNGVDNFVRVNTLEYQPHSSIFIDDNGDFASLGFSGSGTENDPYIIEEYNITGFGPNLINIQNTDVYFEIRNSILNGLNQASTGVNFNNVVNGMIFNNMISGEQEFGISLESSQNVIILSNSIFQNIHALGPGNGGVGIALRNSDDNYITNNSIYDNSGEGMQFFSSSRNLIDYNTIYNNDLDGILVLYEDGTENYPTENIFEYNEIYDNGESGIKLGENGAMNSAIRYNVISGSTDQNLQLLTPSENITITNNDFINPLNFRQAIDNGTNNIFANNYWSNWVSPDLDQNGIVDNPVVIDGLAANEDLTPLVKPNDPDLTYDGDLNHNIIPSVILQPTPGERRLDVISIEWTDAIDSLNHAISYSVYYSSYRSNNWNLLKSELTETLFLWNTNTVQDGDYTIKITQLDSEGLIFETVMSGSFKIVNSGELESTIPTLPFSDYYGLYLAMAVPIIIKKRKEK